MARKKKDEVVSKTSPELTALIQYCQALENALKFYATAQTKAEKRIHFDDGMGDCAHEWVTDDGSIARQALGQEKPCILEYWQAFEG